MEFSGKIGASSPLDQCEPNQRKTVNKHSRSKPLQNWRTILTNAGPSQIINNSRENVTITSTGGKIRIIVVAMLFERSGIS